MDTENIEQGDKVNNEDAGQPGDATGEPNSGDQANSAKTFTQEELDGIIRDRLEQERRQREKAEDKARREAEEKAAKEQGEWQTLAEQHSKRISELEPLETRVEEVEQTADRYKGALQKHLDAQRSGLPSHIIALLDRLDPVDQLEWISDNRDAISGNQGPNGVPPIPRPAGSPSRDEAVKAEEQRLRQSGRYAI